MLMIRLQRVGRIHDPSYRIVVTEKSAGPRAGKSVEVLGHYDARRDAKGNKDLSLNIERAKYWLSVGAQASGTMHNILVREGIIKGKKHDVRPSKVVAKKEEPKAEAPAAPAPEAAAEAPAEGGAEAPKEESPVEAA